LKKPAPYAVGAFPIGSIHKHEELLRIAPQSVSLARIEARSRVKEFVGKFRIGSIREPLLI
jgi:hypothetical protein